LEQAGYRLARGDKRDFVVIDPAGEVHSLARRIEGSKAADIRARMAEVSRDTVPTVEEARGLQAQRAPVPVPPQQVMDKQQAKPAEPERPPAPPAPPSPELVKAFETTRKEIVQPPPQPQTARAASWR
jgi:hypothetical protein